MEPLEERSLLAVITVTSLDDGTLASLAGDGKISLREAIEAANTNTSVDGSVAGAADPVVDFIVFDSGLSGTILLTADELSISEAVTIQGNGAVNTIIDAQQLSRVFDILSGSKDVTFDGVTIRNGKTTGSIEHGGGIRSQSAGTLTILNSELTMNATTGSNAYGGGVFAMGNVAVADSKISNNRSAYYGGGIRSQRFITVTESTISDNEAVFRGGGIDTDDGIETFDTVVTVISSTISGNRLTDANSIGGGILAAQVAVTNSTIGNNSAGSGGGIYAGSVVVLSSTISGNTAKGGGAIYSFAFTRLLNSIVAANKDTFDGSHPDFRENSSVTAQFSLIGDNSGTTYLYAAPVGSPDANGNLIGTHIAPIDPKLAPLADYGGPTQTMALLPGSPAIDAGDPQQAQLVTPTSDISATDATDSTKANRLIDGSGLIDSSGTVATPTIENYATITQSQTPDTAWATKSVSPDYYTGSNTIPELKFQLLKYFNLSSIVVWGYNPFGVSNNEAKTLEVSFSIDGGVTFEDPVTLTHARTAAAAETLDFGAPQTADFVRIRILSNHNGAAGALGGDRVGLGEIRFLTTGPASDQRGNPYSRYIDGDHNGNVRQDMGAYEFKSLVVTTKDDENDLTFDASDLSLREAVAIANVSAGFDTITFDPSLSGQTITLNMGELTVTDSTVILGPGLDKLSIAGGSGATQSRVLNFAGTGANTYRLSGVTVKDGNGAGTNSGFGGAIRFVGADDKLVITDSVIRESTATTGGTDGGGLFADMGTLELTNVTVMNNTAAFGGGLALLEVRGTLTNVTISGNTATTRGGAIVQFASRANSTSDLLILNSTISGNSSAVGAGIRNSTQNGGVASTVTLGNTIVANNTGGGVQLANAAVAGTSATITSLGHNITSDASGNLTADGDLQNTDPRLTPLGNYDSPLPLYALCTGVDTPVAGCTGASPAINAGNNALAMTAGADGVFGNANDLPLVTDARGMPFSRIVNGKVDIGAFEHFVNTAPSCGLLPPFVFIDEDGIRTIPYNCSANDPLQTVTFSVKVFSSDPFARTQDN